MKRSEAGAIINAVVALRNGADVLDSTGYICFLRYGQWRFDG